MILDPDGDAPMGFTGGSISSAKVGIEVRNATPATVMALALQPDTFTAVDQLYDFTTATAATPPVVAWSKTCAPACESTDVVTAIHGTLSPEYCAGDNAGTMLLFESLNDKSTSVSCHRTIKSGLLNF